MSDADHASAAVAEVTIGISVHVDRIGKIDLQPMRDGIRYLIMVQGGQVMGAAARLDRPDVTVAHVDQPGISQSRSAVIDHCATPLLLFMDDDVTIDLDGVQALAAYLDERPELSLVAGIIERKDRQPTQTPVAMTRWNTGRAMTPETMIQVAHIRDIGVRFDPRFGLKGKYPLGDEYVFVTDVLKAGRNGMRVPIYLGHHWGPSTGDDWRDPKLLAARRAVLRRVFGAAAPVVTAGFAIKHRRRLGGWPAAMRFVLGR